MFFFFSEIWFWLILAELVIGTTCVANEKTGFATISLVVFLLALQFGAQVAVGSFLLANWAFILLGFVVYFLVGVLWSFVKWYFYLLDTKEEFIAKKDKYYEDNKGKNDLDAAWGLYFCKELGKTYPPRAKENKSRLVCWMSFWPMSVLWTLLDDIIDRIARNIFNMISGQYQRLSNKVFGMEPK